MSILNLQQTSIKSQLLVVYTLILIHLFLNRTNILKEKAPTTEKEPLLLAFLYLGAVWCQTRAQLQRFIKGVFHYCKLHVIFKSQNKLCNSFSSKNMFSKSLHQVWFAGISVDYALNPISQNVLSILQTEEMNIFPFHL